MKLPPLVFVLGLCGLLPFLAGPFLLTFAPQWLEPQWVDHSWLMYGALISSFMSGTFWGFSAQAAQGPSGMLGLLIASVLLLLTWGSMLLPFEAAVIALGIVFMLLLGADVWRERVLDSIPGYFKLRVGLTVGVLVALTWRLLIARG
jgi:hypothetical protein